jgi:hypothetical protein
MFDFLNKLKTWLGFADINQDGKVDREDVKIVVDVVKTEAKKVVAAKKEAVKEVKTTANAGAKKVIAAKKEAVAAVAETVKRGRPKKTD